MTESGADASEKLVIDGWTVGDVLARVHEVDLDFEWIVWDSTYFAAPQPEPRTALHLRPILASAMIRGYTTGAQDEFCKDRIELIFDMEVSSDDGVLNGMTSAELTLWTHDNQTLLYLSTHADQLGFETIWPLDEDRQPPSEVLLRIESDAMDLGLVEGATGTVWLHWVWLADNGRVPERWEEYFQIGAIGL